MAVVTILTGVGAGCGGMLLALLPHASQHVAYGYSLAHGGGSESFLTGVTQADPLRRLAVLVVRGRLFGFAAYGFVRLTTRARADAPKGRLLPVLALVNFAVIGVLAMRFPQLLGNGKGPASLCFDGTLTIGFAATLLVLKVWIEAGSLRAGAEVGLLTPGLANGALLGVVLGGLWSLMWLMHRSADVRLSVRRRFWLRRCRCRSRPWCCCSNSRARITIVSCRCCWPWPARSSHTGSRSSGRRSVRRRRPLADPHAGRSPECCRHAGENLRFVLILLPTVAARHSRRSTVP